MTMLITFLINALHTAVNETTTQRFRDCGSCVKCVTEELMSTLRINEKYVV
jgi:hypothetical protein